MSLDDLPTGAPQRTAPEAETVVRRVDRAAPHPDKITRAEELRLQLADEIVRGALAPGATLDETDIARRFNVSRTPVREALRQLAASGLVDTRAHRGAVVARPSIERLTGMFEAMAELEALCAGLAAERMLPIERHRLEAVHEELRVLSYAGNPDRFHEVNERFHNAIYAGSQNGYIAEMTLATRVRVQPFRRAQFRNLGRLAKSHAEHDRVVVAIMRGDKISECRRRQYPQLQRDRRSRPLLHTQHAGFWRRGGKRIEPVVRRRCSGLQQATAERLQFAIERHARQMRADHRDGDFVSTQVLRQGRKRWLRQTPAAHVEFGIGMKDAADAGELCVVAGGRQQRDAERDLVGAYRGRQC